MKGIEAFDDIESILVVAAHPDDLETMCGGTLTLLRARGVTVDLLLATDGDLGDPSGALSRPAVATARRRESLQAAARLGLRHLHFLGYPDGELADSLTLRRQVAWAYRRFQPQAVFTFDPLAAFRTNLHPDHRAVAAAAFDAFMPAKMPLYAPEQLSDEVPLSRVTHLYCFATLEPDIVVPIDGVYDEKLALAMLHESQFPKGVESLEWMKNRDRAATAHLPDPTAAYVELFRTVKTY